VQGQEGPIFARFDARPIRAIHRHFGLTRLRIEWLRDNNQPIAALTKVQRIGDVIFSEPKREEILPVGQGGREAHPSAMTVFIKKVAKLDKYLSRRVQGVSVQILPEHCEKDGL
jgi:hypothetical protein